VVILSIYGRIENIQSKEQSDHQDLQQPL